MFESLEMGVLSEIVNKQKVMSAGKAALGGAAAAAIYNVAMTYIPQVATGTPKMALLKKTGLAAAVAIAGGAAADRMGQYEAAHGMAGALGAMIVPLVLAEVGLTIPGLSGLSSSYVTMAPPAAALAGANVYEEDVLGIRVGEEEPEFAGLFAGAMAY